MFVKMQLEGRVTFNRTYMQLASFEKNIMISSKNMNIKYLTSLVVDL